MTNEDHELLKRILPGKMYPKDRTSRITISETIKSGAEVTPRKIRQWRQCDARMKERNLDIDEPPLHVTRDCPQYEHFR